MSDSYKVYPSIGIARVGNSQDAFYVGPESAAALPTLPDGKPFGPEDFRDGSGDLKRQAARFRVYRTRADGSAEEITLQTPGVLEIRWTVHLANKKAGWYEFQTNKGEQGYASNHPLRNASVASDQRHTLFIDPGPRTVVAKPGGDERAEFSRGTIPKDYPGSFPPPDTKPFSIDTLGQLRSESSGALLVLGGLGRSGSSRAPEISNYANNDDWWDDTSDGPVQATIVFSDGREVSVEPAWVLVTPPAYAPQILNLVTLYDTIFDVAVRSLGARPDWYENGLWKRGADGYKPNYRTEIRPILERGEHYPWVAAIPPKAHRFDYERLGTADPALDGFRKYYLDVLRGPNEENNLISTKGATMMPYLAGDDCIGATDKTQSKYLKLTDTQYFLLQQWADGHFVNEPAEPRHPGEMLSQGVLENCVGGAFSPGIEMTWVSRYPELYCEPLRLHMAKVVPAPLSNGLDLKRGLEPGDVTKFMAVPWQADFNECSAQPIGERILWWWPAQRPAMVYIEAAQPKDGPSPTTGQQVPWIGTADDQNADNYIAFANDLEMVESWDRLGFVYNVGSEAEPRFIEVARTLKRE